MAVRNRYVIGQGPDLACLDREAGVTILDLFGEGDAAWVFLRVPANRTDRVKACFRGVCHVYETDEEARRVWRVFGR